MAINLEELRQAIRCITPRQGLYRVLKEELTVQGRWKNQPRGKPSIVHLRGANAPSEEL